MEKKKNGTQLYRQDDALRELRLIEPEATERPDARYYFDGLCSEGKGWLQYDTHQDAWYFGVWIHKERGLTLTYAEGDITLTVSPDEASFREELAEMDSFYGPPPPAFVCFDIEPDGKVGQRTDIIDDRSRRIFEEV